MIQQLLNRKRECMMHLVNILKDLAIRFGTIDIQSKSETEE